MKFEEALNTKTEIGEIVNIQGVEHNVYVVPQNEQDFNSYKEDYYQNTFNGSRIEFTDELAKAYSRDSEFKVCAFYQEQGQTILSVQELKI